MKTVMIVVRRGDQARDLNVYLPPGSKAVSLMSGTMGSSYHDLLMLCDLENAEELAWYRESVLTRIKPRWP